MTDIAMLPRWGRPLLYGPGSILVAHTDEEYIEVFEDASGQFCMFSAVEADGGDATPDAEPDEPGFDDEAEQAAGAEALSQVKH